MLVAECLSDVILLAYSGWRNPTFGLSPHIVKLFGRRVILRKTTIGESTVHSPVS